MCKHKKKKEKETTGFCDTVGDRCINMLCWVSKGISLFFSSVFFSFAHFFKRYFKKPLLRLLECLRNPFYVIDG